MKFMSDSFMTILSVLLAGIILVSCTQSPDLIETSDDLTSDIISGTENNNSYDENNSGSEVSDNEEETTEIIGYKGTFMNGVRRYETSGSVATIITGDTTFLRFENFETTNGPDLFVYLVKPGSKTADGINLGELKSNLGNQNYEVPNNIDLSEYSKVVIWCKAFNADFGFAELSSQ